jgi:hypothetical protein
MRKLILVIVLCSTALCAQKKPVLYVPFSQAEFAYNLIKECQAIDVTWVQEKADFVVAWGTNERENRNDWVVYTLDGKVVSSGEATRVSATARDICKAITK